MERGQIMVVGCSSSEIAAHRIGSYSSGEIGQAVYEALMKELEPREIYLAAQCCEHLNRALVLEKEAAERYGYEMVNVVPALKAGGSFATAAYAGMRCPVAVERIQAHAGIDIGDTLIGMHLRAVAVPVRISVKEIGGARVVCARTCLLYTSFHPRDNGRLHSFQAGPCRGRQPCCSACLHPEALLPLYSASRR